jgi:hypothetical protein
MMLISNNDNAIKELETIVLLYDSSSNDIDSIRKALEACILSCSNNDNDSSKLIALLLPYYLNHNNSNNSSSNTIDSIISSNIDSISVCYPCTISFTITIMIKAIIQYDLTMKSTSSSSSTHYHNTCIRKLISITKLLVRLINIINDYNDATICIYKKALDEMWLLQNSNIDSSIISSRVFIIITLIVVIHMSRSSSSNNNNNNSSSSSSSSSSHDSSKYKTFSVIHKLLLITDSIDSKHKSKPKHHHHQHGASASQYLNEATIMQYRDKTDIPVKAIISSTLT